MKYYRWQRVAFVVELFDSQQVNRHKNNVFGQTSKFGWGYISTLLPFVRQIQRIVYLISTTKKILKYCFVGSKKENKIEIILLAMFLAWPHQKVKQLYLLVPMDHLKRPKIICYLIKFVHAPQDQRHFYICPLIWMKQKHEFWFE